MVASSRRSDSRERLEMESGGKKKRKKRKGEVTGRGKFPLFLPPSPYLHSVVYFFLFNFPLRRPHSVSDTWNSWLLFWSCSLKNWLAYCGAFRLDLSGQWQRQLFVVLPPVFHSSLFLKLTSGPILVASIHSPNHFALPAGISFTRRGAFLGFKAQKQCDRLKKRLNY